MPHRTTDKIPATSPASLRALAWHLASTVLAVVLAAPAWAAQPDPAARLEARIKGDFPQITLGEHGARGQRALDQLGARLPEVAAWYGRSTDDLRRQFLNDRSWRLDRRGRVFIVEEMTRPLAATTAPASTTGLVDGTLAPVDQTFLLHSKPGAQRTIHLNFKGATLTGTAWNSNGNTINALPFDLDGIPYSFTTAELQRIQAIWQRVAEDYAPFDVDVTTEAPTPDKLTRAGAGDTVFGTTVLVTSTAGVYSCSCGGVAYLGVFDETSDTYKPALVFYDMLGGGNEKYVAEAISHEAGHNMGLAHDGSASVGYYAGHGSGATGWAPIMGVGYYQALTQWSKGEYSGANNLQDDFVVMQNNGLPLRADDHGGTPATATALTGTSAGGLVSLAAQGIIERPGDVDMFKFTAGAGSASFSVTPAVRAPNLDALVTLYDAAGAALATVNPADAVNASFSATLPASGVYVLAVTGTGKGDPKTTGYTNYGSLGQYAVAATVPVAAGQAPTAVITASALQGTAPLTVTFNGANSTDADGSVTAWDWAFSNGGTASGPSTARTYATPGTYTTTLRVTDNSGMSNSSSVTVTVQPAVATPTMRVADIEMALGAVRPGTVRATAQVKVVDGNGLPVVGAVVSGTWSGLAPQAARVMTSSTGIARFVSPTVTAVSGQFQFAVTAMLRSGYAYQPLTNTETSDSISR